MDGKLKRIVDNLSDDDIKRAANNKPEDAIPDGIAGWKTGEIITYGILAVALASINAAISAYSDNQALVKPLSIVAAGLSALLGLMAAVFGKTKVNNIATASAAKFKALTLAKKRIYTLKTENDNLKAGKAGSVSNPTNNNAINSTASHVLSTPLLASISPMETHGMNSNDIAMRAILEEHWNEKSNAEGSEETRLFK
jgi:hypothetical protein